MWVDKPKEGQITQFFVNFHKCVVVSYSHADSVAVQSYQFLLLERLFATKSTVLSQVQLETIPTTIW